MGGGGGAFAHLYPTTRVGTPWNTMTARRKTGIFDRRTKNISVDEKGGMGRGGWGGGGGGKGGVLLWLQGRELQVTVCFTSTI